MYVRRTPGSVVIDNGDPFPGLPSEPGRAPVKGWGRSFVDT